MIDFDKNADKLLPAIVQDAKTLRVLMLGYMNAESFEKTRETGRVTFYSRSRERLWTKGETSGNFLTVQETLVDCDADTILIKANPAGPTCHTGVDTCFGETNTGEGFLFELEKIVAERKRTPTSGSYTAKLLESGVGKIAQKVGEEAVEVVIEAMGDDAEKLKAETADLLYHLLVLLAAKDVSLAGVFDVLRERHTSDQRAPGVSI